MQYNMALCIKCLVLDIKWGIYLFLHSVLHVFFIVIIVTGAVILLIVLILMIQILRKPYRGKNADNIKSITCYLHNEIIKITTIITTIFVNFSIFRCWKWPSTFYGKTIFGIIN